MPDEPPTESKLSAVAIARDWGVRRQYASKMIKLGCPADSLEAARAWRAARSPRGVGYRSHSKEPELAPTLPVSEAEVGAVEKMRGDGGDQSEFAVASRDLTSREDSLTAAIEVEQEAHRLVVMAQMAGANDLMVQRIAAYTKAQSGRLDAEAALLDLKERERILVPLDDAKALISRAFTPILNRLRALPRNLALKVNPTDDVHAEHILTEECERIILEVRDEAYAPAH